jgi:hypothetical protein
VAIAYALDGGKDKKAKTVLRGGYGFFYDRFESRGMRTIKQAESQNQIVLNNPNCATSATSLDTIDLSKCFSTGGSSSSASTPVKYEIDAHYHSPYNQQASISVERQLTATTSMTLNYMHSYGVHQMVTRNANQATGGTPQTNSGGYLYEYYSEAVFKQNQLIASVNAAFGKKFNLTSFYTLSFANTNSNGGASNGYNLDEDYGRAGFVARNMLFMMGSYNGPLGIRFNPFLLAQSGRPYNITLPTDSLNNFFDQRPTFATSATPSANQIATPYGTIDMTGLTGTTIPVNLGNGPAAFAFNLRVSRGFGIGPKLASANATPSADGGPPAGGPPPGAGRGGPGGGGPPGGGRGGFGGGMGGP